MPSAEPEAASEREAVSEWVPSAEPGPEQENDLPTWVPNGSAERGQVAAGTVPPGGPMPSRDDVLSGPRQAPDAWTYRPPSAPGPGRAAAASSSSAASPPGAPPWPPWPDAN